MLACHWGHPAWLRVSVKFHGFCDISPFQRSRGLAGCPHLSWMSLAYLWSFCDQVLHCCYDVFASSAFLRTDSRCPRSSISNMFMKFMKSFKTLTRIHGRQKPCRPAADPSASPFRPTPWSRVLSILLPNLFVMVVSLHVRHRQFLP